jgi:hypothetical protein
MGFLKASARGLVDLMVLASSILGTQISLVNPLHAGW